MDLQKIKEGVIGQKGIAGINGKNANPTSFKILSSEDWEKLFKENDTNGFQ